jgi:oxygen-independent coproporphyrinogen-3 oxidase
VFFGGGTPSALPGRSFRRLWGALRSRFTIAPDAEITLEANPESVRESLLEAWADAGVNRLSMGAQSFDSADLERLGRIHGPERPAIAFGLARQAGFRRLSLDLMFGFPGHTPERFAATIEQALALEPEHLSVYNFIPEAGTPLGDEVLRGATPLPEPEQEADLYAVLCDRLARAGLGTYETSNFCRRDAEARHNLVYWLRRDYLALGPSAHGCWRGMRYGNHYRLDDWARALESNGTWDVSEPETARLRADEIVMLGLRLATGVRAPHHPTERWQEVEQRFGRAFEEGIATGRLETTADGVRIPPSHRFVADDVIAWLMAAADRGMWKTPATHGIDRAERRGFDTLATPSVP